jgi:hypothetical protein
MRRVLSLALAVTFVIGTVDKAARAAEDEMVPNPPYKHWSAFKVGTTVTQKERIKFAEGSEEHDFYAGGVHEKDIVYTLIEVTPAKAVVQVVFTEYGAGSITELAPSKITFPAMIKKAHSKSSKQDIEVFKEGDEEVTLLGKPVRAHWIEITDKEGDEVFYNKKWESDEIPGGTVKEIKSETKGGHLVAQTDYEIVSFHKP